MAKVNLPDGQSFDFPDELAGDDAMLRAALASFVPEIRNADLKRGTVGGVMTVNVIKRSGTKGAVILEALLAAPESLNPAIEMQQRLQALETAGKLTLSDLLAQRGALAKAIDAGQKEVSRVNDALKVLKDADAQSAQTTPVGF